MISQAGGRLYWPLERVLHTDINYVQLAIKGHYQWMVDIFGAAEEPTINSKAPLPLDAKGKPIVITPNIFDAQFATHGQRNIRYK